jgi:hypothetical protein
MLNDSAKELAELTVLIMDEGLLESGRAAPVTLHVGTGGPKVDRLSRVGPWGRGVHPTTAEAPRV